MIGTKIAVITASKFPGTSGDTANFSEMINQLVAEGFKVSLICPKNTDSDDKKLEISSDVDIVRIPFVPPRFIEIKNGISGRHYLRLLLFLLIEACVVLWTIKYKRIQYAFMRHSMLTIQVPFILKLLRVKVMADGIEPVSEVFKDRFGPRLLGLIKNYERKAVNLYSYLMASTPGQVENLQKFGFPKERILIVPRGINLDKVPIFSIEEIPEHTFGYFGVLERLQGIDRLLKGFAILVKQIPNAILYVIGDGSLKEELKEIVTLNNMSSNVVFTTVSREILWKEYFKKFRIAVIPRPKQNNGTDAILSIKLVESLAAAKPTIVVDIPAMKEIPNHSVYIVPTADPESLAKAMATLSMNIEMMKRYAQAGFSYSRNYNIKDTMKKVISVLVDGD